VTALLLMTVAVAGCSLLGGPPFRTRDEPREIAIPTSSIVATGDDVEFGWLRVAGSCLYLTTVRDNRDGPDILPIWPQGYRAKAWSMGHGVYRPDEWPDFALVAGAEPLELRGEYVDAPPPDTTISADCPDLALFAVREAINRADG
jgi:hypothetical protein